MNWYIFWLAGYCTFITALAYWLLERMLDWRWQAEERERTCNELIDYLNEAVVNKGEGNGSRVADRVDVHAGANL